MEAPYLYKGPPPVVRRPFDTASAPDLSHLSDVSGMSIGSSARRTSKSIPSAPLIPSPTESTGSLPELENFDPTYGLRPDGLPMKSMFSGFGRLFKQNKGLADLTEEQSEEEDEEKEEEEEEEEEKGSYSVVDWEDTSIGYSPPPSLAPDDSITEYEAIPAVGGGIITRPRVYHSQSMIQPPAEISRTNTDPGSVAASLRPNFRHPISPSQQAGPSRANSSQYNPLPFHRLSLSSSPAPNRTSTDPGSVTTPTPSFRHPRSPPQQTGPLRASSFPYGHPLPSYRRLSVSSSTSVNPDPFFSGSPPQHHAMSEADPKIILRPTLNNSLHQLSTLSHSNHTLSPYTRSLEHFAVRSGPPRTLNAFGVRAPPERRPVKAKRKRTYRIGGKSPPQPDPDPNDHPPRTSAPSPVPPSEFDPSEIDQYFRSWDDVDGFVGEPGPSRYGQ